MKYWKIGVTRAGYGNDGLILLDGDNDRVVSLSKSENGDISFSEECDGYFQVSLSKTEAKAALEEAIKWLENT